MSPSTRSKLSPQKVQARRRQLRKRRPIETSLPDVGSKEFAAEARRQSRLVARSPYEKEDQALIDAISDWGDG